MGFPASVTAGRTSVAGVPARLVAGVCEGVGVACSGVIVLTDIRGANLTCFPLSLESASEPCDSSSFSMFPMLMIDLNGRGPDVSSGVMLIGGMSR